MIGPKPAGYWTSSAPGVVRPFSLLQPGTTYKVRTTFVDYDGDRHLVDEEWTFVGHSFLPHDDGLSIFVSLDNHEWQIRMSWQPEAQGSVIDALPEYLSEVVT